MFNFWKVQISLILMIFLISTARADLDLISRFLLSNKKYAKHIVVRSSVLPEDQLMEFCGSTNLPTEQINNRDLYNKKLYLVVQCKNIGELCPFGEMKFKIEGRNLLVPVFCAELFGNMEKFYNCAIIYIGEGIVPNNDERLSITYYWESLYTI